MAVTSYEEPKMQKIVLEVDIEKLKIFNSKVLMYVKKEEIKMDKIQSNPKYLRHVFDILNMGFINSEFNLFRTFHDCIKNALIPIFVNLKANY